MNRQEPCFVKHLSLVHWIWWRSSKATCRRGSHKSLRLILSFSSRSYRKKWLVTSSFYDLMLTANDLFRSRYSLLHLNDQDDWYQLVLIEKYLWMDLIDQWAKNRCKSNDKKLTDNCQIRFRSTVNRYEMMDNELPFNERPWIWRNQRIDHQLTICLAIERPKAKVDYLSDMKHEPS